MTRWQRIAEELGFPQHDSPTPREWAETISRLHETAMERDQGLQMFPTSYLPATPAGRIQAVQELLEEGFISRRDALRMLQDAPGGRAGVGTVRRRAIPDLDELVKP